MNFDMSPYGAFIWPAYGISALGKISGCQVFTITLYTNTPLTFASKYRTNFNSFNTCIFNFPGLFVGNFFTRTNYQLIG
jgi:hypothetical protein